MENQTIMSRSSLSILILLLLMYSVLPVTQLGWSMDLRSGNACAGSGDRAADTGEANDSEDESSQETLDDCLVSEPRTFDHVSTIHHAAMSVVPPSALLVSCLFHPPTPLR